MLNAVRVKLSQNKKPMGTFFESGSETIIEALAMAGLDYVIIDGEHGPFETEQMLRFVRAAENSAITPFVRIKEISRSAVLKALDIGAMGLIVPCLSSLKDAQDLVRWAKYKPEGERGFFQARTSAFGHADFARDFPTYFATSSREQMLLPQCETAGALADIEDIVGLSGVDGIFVGPYDLSIGLGMPGAFTEAAFQKALKRIIKACHEVGKPAFIYAGNGETAQAYDDLGFDSVTLSMDVTFLIDGVRQARKKILGEIT